MTDICKFSIMTVKALTKRLLYINKIAKINNYSYFNLLKFFKDFFRFKKSSNESSRKFLPTLIDTYPCLKDKTDTTYFDRHYVYHTAWAARKVAKLKPDIHIDISSSLYFCSIVSAFNPVKFYDYRPANLCLDNLFSEASDLLKLPFEKDSIHSLSCMHVVEHIGLGRYGDPLDPDGDLKAIAELKRVLAIDGSLLFVVPVGQPKIMFNAHRIYSYEQILDYFSDLHLEEFALIPEQDQQGGLVYNAPKELVDSQVYGCGCFWFKKEKKR